MKKAFSIILAVIMVFSACGLLASAESVNAITVDKLPVMPAAEEGKIYFAAENAFVKANDTVDIPVYLISNYNTSCTNGFVELGFRFTLTGAPCTVNSVSWADGIKAVNGFKEFRCFYGEPAEGFFPDWFDADSMAMYRPGTLDGWGQVVFAAGLEVLHQEKVQVATINVTVGENFNEDYDEEDLTAESEFVAVELYEYNFADTFAGCWFDGVAAVIEGELTDDVFEANYQATYDETDFDNLVMHATDIIPADDYSDVLGFSYGILMGNPPHEVWTSKLSNWLRASFEAIFAEIDKIRDIFLTIIDAIKLI